MSINSLGQRASKTISIPMPVNETLSNNISDDNQGETYEVVNATSVNIRSAASTSSRIVGKLKKGERIIVLSISNGWARCVSNGKEVFVSSRYLKKIEVEPPIDESISNVEETSEPLPITEQTPMTTQVYDTETSSEGKAGKIGCIMGMDFGGIFPNLGDASKYVDNGFCCGITATMGARYYATENVFIEGLVGWKTAFTNSKTKYTSTETSNTLHYLTIPLHLGCQLPSTGKVAFGLFLGPRFDIALFGKSEVTEGNHTENEKLKIDDHLFTMIDCGIDVVFKNGTMRLQYGYSPKKENKYSIISVGFMSNF